MEENWKPIDIAPKDEQILLFGGYVSMGCYDELNSEWCMADIEFSDGALRHPDDFGYEKTSCEPTHWMPLPKKPLST